jgi:hypothetical protein
VGRIRIKAELNVAPECAAFGDKFGAASWRYFFVGRALEHAHGSVGQDSVVELSFQSACGIEYQPGPKAGGRRWRIDAGRRAGQGRKRSTAAIGPSLQRHAIGDDVVAAPQIGQRAIGIQRAHGDFI